jgi:hypothetical protein
LASLPRTVISDSGVLLERVTENLRRQPKDNERARVQIA